jgi:diguanylate cyclase (GGDEF)-like protein
MRPLPEIGAPDGFEPVAEVVDDRTRERVIRGLLWAFIVLTAVIACVGVAVGSYREAAISAVGGAVYALLLVGLPRLGPGVTGHLCTAWYFLLAVGAMTAGRGIHDVTIVLFPTGIFMGAMLLRRRHLLPLIVLTVAAVSAVGAWRILSPPPSSELGRNEIADVVVAALLLLVAGILTHHIMRSLQAMAAARRDAQRAEARSREELEERNQALEIVNELAERLHRTLAVEAIAGETVDVLIRHTNPPLVAFYLFGDDRTRLRLVAAYGFTDEERTSGSSLPVHGSLSGIAVREQRLVTSDDLAADPRADETVRSILAHRGAGTALCIPLAFAGTALGTVNLVYRERRALSQVDLDTFRAIGQAVSLAIANARHVADLEHQAFHDALTGLPNRAGLHRRFGGDIGRGGMSVGLVLLDLSRFRQINEAFGHAVGDQLLIQIAGRLRECLSSGRGELFRLGGDEFAAVLPSRDGSARAEATARELIAALHRPFEVGSMALAVGASAGISSSPAHGRNSHDLLRCADVALYHAKRSPGGVAGYAPELDEHTPERLAMMADLAKAIRDGGLALHFQPKVSLRDGEVVGFEALVRWPHPRLGMLLPATFIPSAEGSEVVNPLTYWVVEHALEQLARWNRHRPDLTMAINLSVQILLDRNCSQRLEEIIRRVGVAPDRVEFELTETAILADPETALSTLRRITSGGARLAIDDFGTGYSSLSYLTRFPVHEIKIDRSFVAGLASGGQNLVIVRSTVELARGLGLAVVAEGIEDRQTADVLRDIGCEMAQGFYFAHPAPAEEVGARLLAAGGQRYH